MSLGIEILNTTEELKAVYNNNLESLNKGSASYINKHRWEAYKHFEKLGIPTTKNEDYKYTNLEPVFLKQYNYQLEEPTITFDIEDIFKCDIPELDTDVILLVNGWYYSSNNEPFKKCKNGVIIGSLYHAANKYPELIERHYGKYALIFFKRFWKSAVFSFKKRKIS